MDKKGYVEMKTSEYNLKLEKMTAKEVLIVNMLANLYMNLYNTDEFDYSTVDDFYAYIGYDLESQQLLLDLRIECTSDLQELLLRVENYL